MAHLNHVGIRAVGIVAMHEANGDVAQVGANQEALIVGARPLHNLDQCLVELARERDRLRRERALEHENCATRTEPANVQAQQGRLWRRWGSGVYDC